MIRDIVFLSFLIGVFFVKVIIVGYCHLDYVNREGKRIIGHRLYCMYESHNTIGHRTMECYFPETALDAVPEIGSEATIMFNQYGRAISVIFLS